MSGGDISVKVDRRLAGLIPRFFAQLRVEIAELRRAMEAGNFSAARAIGHTLRGSGGGYGFDEITRLGIEIEDAARSGDAQAVARLTDGLEHYVEHVKPVYE